MMSKKTINVITIAIVVVMVSNDIDNGNRIFIVDREEFGGKDDGNRV